MANCEAAAKIAARLLLLIAARYIALRPRAAAVKLPVIACAWIIANCFNCDLFMMFLPYFSELNGNAADHLFLLRPIAALLSHP